MARGLAKKGELVKVLGRGSLSSAISVKAHAFSASAEAAITNAGGSIETLDKPFKVRPAAQGNQHANR